MKETIVYCDGACSGNPGPGGWGAILLLPDDTVRELGGAAADTTNNRMELTGAIVALESLPPVQPVEVRTDSKYVIDGITKWIHGWKKKGWRSAADEPVKNRDLWERLDAAVTARKAAVRWTYVAGHSGIGGNERADAISVAFAKRIPLPLYEGPATHYDGFDLGVAIPPPKAKVSGPKGKPFYLSYVSGEVKRHETWADCERRVRGASGAKYKKVSSDAEAKSVLATWGAPST